MRSHFYNFNYQPDRLQFAYSAAWAGAVERISRNRGRRQSSFL